MKKKIAGFATAFAIATGVYVGLLYKLIVEGQDLFGVLAYGIGIGACWVLAMVGTYKSIFKES